MNVESAPKRGLNRLGIYAAASYLFIIVVVYAITAYISPSDPGGYEWVPFFLLTKVGSKNEAPFSGRVPHVRPGVHGPKTDSSNAFAPLRKDSCP
jgi:hypothetical protein